MVSLPSERSARSRTSPGRVSERRILPLLGLDRVCSQRTQRACGTAMRLCASLFRRRRGPAGLRNPFSFLSKLRLVCPALRGFPCVRRRGGYHYPRCALRAVETPDDRLQKRLTCRFLRSDGRSSPHDSYFLANTQNFLPTTPVANAFALWYDKFDKLEFDAMWIVLISCGIIHSVFHSYQQNSIELYSFHQELLCKEFYYLVRLLSSC